MCMTIFSTSHYQKLISSLYFIFKNGKKEFSEFKVQGVV